MSATDAELQELEKKIAQQKAEEIPVPVPTPEPPQPNQEQIPPVEAPVTTPPEQTEAKTEGFDPADYVKKKGWKTAEDAAQSFRELEKKFHEGNQKPKEVPQYGQPPMAPNSYPPGAYQPPVNPWGPQPQISEEQVAASYGWHVDDFRKMLPLLRDMTQAQLRQVREENQKRWEDMNRQAERSTDMTNVFAHPAFGNTDVRAEMHEILTKNPELMKESKPYSTALKEALANLGLRSIAGGNRPGPTVQTTPPEMAGSKGAGGSLPGKRLSMPSMKELEGKTPEEMEKILKSAGIHRTHMDVA